MKKVIEKAHGTMQNIDPKKNPYTTIVGIALIIIALAPYGFGSFYELKSVPDWRLHTGIFLFGFGTLFFSDKFFGMIGDGIGILIKRLVEIIK